MVSGSLLTNVVEYGDNFYRGVFLPMFSHLVSAARGLFASSDSSHQLSGSDKQAKTDTETMVTTRRSILSQVEDSSPSRDNSPAVNGKRKTVSSVTELTFEPTPKRRRGQAKKEAESEVSAPQPNGVKKRPYKILEAVEIRSSGSNTRESSILTPTTNPEEISKKISLRPKTAHVRFGSEEPEHELSGVEEIAPRDEENVPQQEMDDDDSDDEAPEAISNTKQLQGLKEAERKREEARQKYDQHLPATYSIHPMLTSYQ